MHGLQQVSLETLIDAEIEPVRTVLMLPPVPLPCGHHPDGGQNVPTADRGLHQSLVTPDLPRVIGASPTPPLNFHECPRLCYITRGGDEAVQQNRDRLENDR
jgi:hypothetical protein